MTLACACSAVVLRGGGNLSADRGPAAAPTALTTAPAGMPIRLDYPRYLRQGAPSCGTLQFCFSGGSSRHIQGLRSEKFLKFLAEFSEGSARAWSECNPDNLRFITERTALITALATNLFTAAWLSWVMPVAGSGL